MRKEIFCFLLSHNVNIDEKTRKGETMLHNASLEMHADEMDDLCLSEGVDINGHSFI